MNPTAAILDDALQMRHADADLLSLALMQSRNQTLAWLSLFERHRDAPPPQPETFFEPALWLGGHAAWRQERWIARNLQRRSGVRGESNAPLASIEPQADGWWSEAALADRAGWAAHAPGFDTVRSYAAETLEITLELLAAAPPDDAGLRLYRAALFDEDALQRRFVALAQVCRIEAAARMLPPRRTLVLRPPLVFAAQAWSPGWSGSNMLGAAAPPRAEAVPEFEIDAQPVSWAQYAEFVEDGGYDEPRWWSAAGWDWVQREQRRTPRDVEQVRHGVLLRRFGRLQRAPAVEPATMLSWFEADAWCRWAGRRLPTAIEWELAASLGASRGLAWGDVPEWVAGRDRPASGGALCTVQRGLAWFEPRRLAHPKSRRFASAERDEGFAGFRSAAL